MKLCAAVELFLELRPAVDVERSPVASRSRQQVFALRYCRAQTCGFESAHLPSCTAQRERERDYNAFASQQV